MEITYKEKTYKFKAGMAFLRSINKTIKRPIEATGASIHMGLETHVAMLLAGDVETLALFLDKLNEHAGGPRLENRVIDAYLEDETTDLDEVFQMVVDFLSNANVCKKSVNNLKKEMGLEPQTKA